MWYEERTFLQVTNPETAYWRLVETVSVGGAYTYVAIEQKVLDALYVLVFLGDSRKPSELGDHVNIVNTARRKLDIIFVAHQFSDEELPLIDVMHEGTIAFRYIDYDELREEVDEHSDARTYRVAFDSWALDVLNFPNVRQTVWKMVANNMGEASGNFKIDILVTATVVQFLPQTLPAEGSSILKQYSVRDVSIPRLFSGIRQGHCLFANQAPRLKPRRAILGIEQRAVNEINELFEVCTRLDPQIAVNDRGLLTDGYIDVFKTGNMNHATSDFAGRVNVQVKGNTVNKFEGNLAYPVTREALEGFLKVKGVLYFVVALQKDNKKMAYYLDLSPFEIIHILNDMKPRARQKTLHFKRLPHTSEALTRVVDLALTRQQENPLVSIDSIDLDKVRGFTIHTLDGVDLTRPITLDKNETDFALELNTASGRVLIDANVMLTPHEYLPKKIETAVASGSWEVDHYNWRRISESQSEAVITEGIRFTSMRSEENTSLSVAWTPRDNLAHRHFDLGFIISLMETGELRFGSESGILHGPQPAEFEVMQKQFEVLDKLLTLLTRLEIDASLISLESITDKQWRQLKDMYVAIVEGKEFRQDIATSDRRILQPVGPWFIELFVWPGEKDGYWTLHGITDPRTASWAVRSMTDPEHPLFYVVTPYEVISNERLSRTLNLRPTAINEHYESIREYEHCSEMATDRVLDFIRVADSKEQRKEEFLELAERLNEWLIAKDGEQPHLLINRWQISARRAPLTSEDLSVVRTLRRQLGHDRHDLYHAIGCAILLEDGGEVDDLERELTENEVLLVESWPIWTLWNQTQVKGLVTRKA